MLMLKKTLNIYGFKIYFTRIYKLNSLWPNDVIWSERTWSMVQVMACHPFGAKPLPKPIPTYCQLKAWNSVKFQSKIQAFSFEKLYLRMLSARWRLFYSGLRVCYILNWYLEHFQLWWHRSGSTLAYVMVCCLTTPRHFLNQCWLIITKVKWHSSDISFTRDATAINHWNQFENYFYESSFKSPTGHWVKETWPYCINALEHTCQSQTWGLPWDHSKKCMNLTHWPLGDSNNILEKKIPS